MRIQKLAEKAKDYDREFKIQDLILDKYLTTRYPDVIALQAIPFESFTEKEARQAIDLATELFDSVKEKIESNR
jgi:HEPN domain-containing protein